MNEIIGYYIKTLSNRTLSKDKGILVDKPLGNDLTMMVKFKNLFLNEIIN